MFFWFQTDGACSLESFVTTTASDPSSFGHVPSSATLDSLMSDDERFNQLCEQMQRLPQLDDPSSQSYMVVPETPDGQQGTPFVLDPSQLAHLQALAQPFLQNTFHQVRCSMNDLCLVKIGIPFYKILDQTKLQNGIWVYRLSCCFKSTS